MISITISVNVTLGSGICVKSKLLFYLVFICQVLKSSLMGRSKHTGEFAFFIAIITIYETKWISNLVVRCGVQFNAHH